MSEQKSTAPLRWSNQSNECGTVDYQRRCERPPPATNRAAENNCFQRCERPPRSTNRAAERCERPRPRPPQTSRTCRQRGIPSNQCADIFLKKHLHLSQEDLINLLVVQEKSWNAQEKLINEDIQQYTAIEQHHTRIGTKQ